MKEALQYSCPTYGLVERHVDVEGRVEVLQKRVLRIFVGEVGVFGWNAPVDA